METRSFANQGVNMVYALLLAVLAQSPPSSVPPSGPIVVGTATVGSLRSGEATAEFDLTNSTDKAITAWRVTIDAVRTDGMVLRFTLAKDGYASYAGALPDQGHFIAPRSTVHISEVLNKESPGSIQRVDVGVKSVIFADRTWAGDSDDVRVFFAGRERDYAALTDVINALRKGSLSAHGVDSLRVALTELNRPDLQDSDHVLKQMMRKNLDNAIRVMPPTSSSPDQSLRAWLTFFEARWQAAQDHRVQGVRANIK
jgi:hypothetical protein